MHLFFGDSASQDGDTELWKPHIFSDRACGDPERGRAGMRRSGTGDTWDVGDPDCGKLGC